VEHEGGATPNGAEATIIWVLNRHKAEVSHSVPAASEDLSNAPPTSPTHEVNKRTGLWDGKQLFFCLYFIMTGLHAIHIIGIGIMAVLMALYAFRPYWSRPNRHAWKMTGLYRHFVDIVWISCSYPHLIGGH